MIERGRLGPIEWAAARRAIPGEQACGDLSVALNIAGGAALFGVVDGLGHGAAAAEAAAFAAGVLTRARAQLLEVLIHRCHLALADTRGAAMTLAHIDFDSGALSWIGVGNVTAALVAKNASGPH